MFFYVMVFFCEVLFSFNRYFSKRDGSLIELIIYRLFEDGLI